MNKYLPVFIVFGNFIPNFSLAAAKDVGFFDLRQTVRRASCRGGVDADDLEGCSYPVR